MTKITTLAGVSALILMSTAAFAAPCATGTTVTRDKEASKASTVDPSVKSPTTPGAKTESPGTVGAMTNAGTATSPSDVQAQSQDHSAAQAGKSGDDC
jgi:hypothetical protein